jgi:hypothetical protein
MVRTTSKVKTIAQRYDVSERTVWRWIATKRVDVARVDGITRIYDDSAAALFASGATESAA